MRLLLPLLLLPLLLIGTTANLSAQETPGQKLAEYDPSGLIRFASEKEAEARREKLIRYLWPDGLPVTALPKREAVAAEIFENDLKGIDSEPARSVERLSIDVAPFEFHATCYLLQPKAVNTNSRRLVIIHSGHRRPGPIGEGVNDSANALLRAGFQVAMVDMPLIGWNQHNTAKIPSGEVVSFGPRHDDMFRVLTPHLADGTVFRLFVEPVVQTINSFYAVTKVAQDVTMIGLSGGGWATHFCAAIDPRIRTSFPVAGAMPLYARKLSPGSWGDSEQFYEPLYGEADGDGDGITDKAVGVASWLEIFALGAIGSNRRQVQVLNYSDPCCFSTDVYSSYDQFLQKKVGEIGAGSWSVYSDRSHKKHIISLAVIDGVILPALAQGESNASGRNMRRLILVNR